MDEEKFTLNNTTNDHNADRTKQDSKQTNENFQRRTNYNNNKSIFQPDNTLLNIVSDLRKIDELDPGLKKMIQANLENQASLILDKPVFIGGDIMHESAGYLEEDDVDSKENFENLSESFFNTEDRNERKEEEPMPYENKIRNLAELKNALHEKNKHNKYMIEFEEKHFTFQEKRQGHQILKAEEFIFILKHLYNELHPRLVEMNDGFDEERRRYFQKDEKIYVSIINYNLQKKEEFFLSVVSNLMGRLSITQHILDTTFYYYFTLADQTLPLVKQMKESYEEVYNAGLKYSIAPKNLTKKLLRKIYLFQLELYEKYSRKNLYKPDVIEIMIVDNVYAEFGLDSECIKAAAKKYNIKEDPEFKPLLQKISNFHHNSFII